MINRETDSVHQVDGICASYRSIDAFGLYNLNKFFVDFFDQRGGLPLDFLIIIIINNCGFCVIAAEQH